MLQVRNTYDGSARIAVHIGAFRFVCPNPVGGGGVFAGGLVSIHAGEIPLEQMAEQLADYLRRFAQVVQLFRQWSEQRMERGALESVLKESSSGRFAGFRDEVLHAAPVTVFDGYNHLTKYATHSMRSAKTAFDTLETVNTSLQKAFPLVDRAVVENDVEHRVPQLIETVDPCKSDAVCPSAQTNSRGRFLFD